MQYLQLFGIPIPYLQTFQSRLMYVLIALVAWGLVNSILFIRWLLIRKYRIYQYRWLQAQWLSIIIIVLNVFIVSSVSFVVTETILLKPEIISADPPINSTLNWADEPIHLSFNLPVATDTIMFHVSPEVKGKWEWKSSQEVTFFPEESFYPESRIIIYAVGIRPIWSRWTSHEQSIEFDAPKIPSLQESSPKNNDTDIPVDQPLRFSFDHPTGKFVDIQYAFTPDPGSFYVIDQANTQELQFDQPLKQDQSYTVIIHRTPRSYKVSDGSDITRGDTQDIATITFQTVHTPLIASYEPRGTGVLPGQTIRINFDQPMDQSSVEDHVTITPPVEGKISWDGTTFIYTPTDVLAKDTAYSVLFSKGMESQAGGQTGEDASIEFTTIGHADVTTISPYPGSTGVDPTSTSVRFTFNQPVDHESVDQNIEFNPRLDAETSWEDNTLIIQTAGKLDYSKRYQITIKSGIRSIDGLDSNKDFTASFTTRDQIYSLAVPYHRQQEQFSCNIAAALMVLSYRGISRSEDEIKSAIGIGQDPNSNWVEGYGIHAGPIASYLNTVRQSQIKQNWSIKELVNEVQQGNPVIAWVYNRYSSPAGPIELDGGYRGYNGMHSEVVTGFIGTSDHPTQILTNDPWRGKLTYTISQFESIWSYLGNTAIVVY
ncbi:hypothetical protein HGA91_05970 [candidate division WWE3 bacterium]|nr:hypothetical protein [candidate division WWE3 bacterium]